MRYHLRPATEEDREWAYQLKREAYLEVVERQFGPWDEERQRTLFAERWNPGISKIVTVEGADVGLVAVEDLGTEICLDEIQLAEGWRGRGLGSEIVGDLLANARERSKPLKLQVLRENTRAKDLYLRLGFEVVGETETHCVMRAVQLAAAPDGGRVALEDQ